MKLSGLLKKQDNAKVATATPATFATHSRENRATVATVATVAVAVAVANSGNTAAAPDDPNREARRQKALAILETDPDSKRAVFVDDGDPDCVILTVAVRNVATCEMVIPRAKYDPWQLLQLIERTH